MPATAHVVRVQYVQPENLAALFGDGAVGLCGKELPAGFGREQVLLREGDAVFDHLVPDADHCRKVRFAVLPDNHRGKDRTLCGQRCQRKKVYMLSERVF